MTARSLRQQADILALLQADARFANVMIFSEAKGVAESEVDAMLSAHKVRGGKKAGLVVIVTQPIERPDPQQAQPILMMRTHGVRIIEVPQINRASGGTQIPADLAKDYILQRLQLRYLDKAALMWAGNDPWEDAKGGYGWTLSFAIRDDLATEERAAVPIVSIAGGMCTLTGASTPGEVIYYTIDGTAPVPGEAGTQIYAAPFAVASGVTVRASTIATGKALSDFQEEEAPEAAPIDEGFAYEPGDSLAEATDSRASVATYRDSDDVVQTAAIDVPRDGHYIGAERTLLLEEARTNDIIQSRDLTHISTWINSNVATARGGVAPDGGQATRITPLAIIAATYLYSSITRQNNSTISVYAKADGCRYLWLSGSYALNRWAEFDLISGTATPSGTGVTAEIEDIGGGWFRCSMFHPVGEAGVGFVATAYQTHVLAPAVGEVHDGVSGVYLWQAQSEVGAFATSPIYTAGATATRAVDALSFPDPEIAGDWLQTETFIDLATGAEDEVETPGSGALPITLSVNRAYLSVTRVPA